MPLWKQCLLFISMETTTDTKSTMALFEILSYKNIIFQYAVLMFTVWSPWMFSKHRWRSVGAIFASWRNSVTHLWFICTSISDTLCQNAPLLPSVTQQQHVMKSWWEASASTAVPPTSASDVVGQPHNIERALLLEQPSYIHSGREYP